MSWTCSCPYTPPLAYDSDERTTARVPATAHQPLSDGNPASSATPRKPIATPAMRRSPTGSCGRNFAASTNVNSGTVDCAIPATLESMCVSPQATRVIGTAALMTPRTRDGRHAARSSRTARAAPIRHARYPKSRTPARSTRSSVIAAGGMSSTATLMKRYDAPHIAARSRISGQ